MCKKENLRRGLEELQRSKQAWKEREQMEIEEENRRIWKYLQEQEFRNEQAKAIASEKLKQSFAVAERMCAELEDIEVSFIFCREVIAQSLLNSISSSNKPDAVKNCCFR